MASQKNSDEDERGPKLDFTSGSFLNRREPIKELINTFSDLYIDSEEEIEGSEAEMVPDFADMLPLPPPPPEPEEEQVPELYASLTALKVQLTAKFNMLESRLEECAKKMSECVTFVEMQDGCRAIEGRMNYRIERECERVQAKVKLEIQDLGKSMVDCLKRRDAQIDHKLKTRVPLESTPIHSNKNFSIPVADSTGMNQTYHVPRSQLPCPESRSMMSLHPPVKVDFLNFSNSEEEDPVNFIERCEEYFAI